MDIDSESIRRTLRQKGIFVSNDWLEHAIQFCIQKTPPSVLRQLDFNQEIFKLFLYSDYRESRDDSISQNQTDIPECITQAHKFQLSKSIVFQINEIANVGASFDQITSGHDPRLLKLCLTDGVQMFVGIELTPIPTLSLSTPAGAKILIRGGQIWQGALLLMPSHATILGGEVPHLVESQSNLLKCTSAASSNSTSRPATNGNESSIPVPTPSPAPPHLFVQSATLADTSNAQSNYQTSPSTTVPVGHLEQHSCRSSTSNPITRTPNFSNANNNTFTSQLQPHSISYTSTNVTILPRRIDERDSSVLQSNSTAIEMMDSFPYDIISAIEYDPITPTYNAVENKDRKIGKCGPEDDGNVQQKRECDHTDTASSHVAMKNKPTFEHLEIDKRPLTDSKMNKKDHKTPFLISADNMAGTESVTPKRSSLIDLTFSPPSPLDNDSIDSDLYLENISASVATRDNSNQKIKLQSFVEYDSAKCHMNTNDNEILKNINIRRHSHIYETVVDDYERSQRQLCIDGDYNWTNNTRHKSEADDDAKAHLFSFFSVSDEELVAHGFNANDPVKVQAAASRVTKLRVDNEKFYCLILMNDGVEDALVRLHHNVVESALKISSETYLRETCDSSFSPKERKLKKAEYVRVLLGLVGIFLGKRIKYDYYVENNENNQYNEESEPHIEFLEFYGEIDEY